MRRDSAVGLPDGTAAAVVMPQSDEPPMAASVVGVPPLAAAAAIGMPPLAAAAAIDVGAAAAASMAVSPFILTIDKAIVSAAAGRSTLVNGVVNGVVDMLRRPHRSLLLNPAYWMVAGVYGVTYAAANLIDTTCRRNAAGEALHGTTKLLGTTAVNTSACIAKDVAFARMFGAQSAAAGPMPLATIGLFGARDLLTIASAFTVPKPLAAAFASGGVDKSRAEDAAQLVSPVGMQLFCAPLHLLALNMYNMPSATLRERAVAVARTAPQTIVAYAVRMAPAFGIGGVINASLTTLGHERLRDSHARRLASGDAPRLQLALTH